MSHSTHRDSSGFGLSLPLVREVSAVTLAFVVFLATVRLVRYPLLALPLAGLAYWGARTWIHRVAKSDASRIGRFVDRLHELAEGLARGTEDRNDSTARSRSTAVTRLRSLAEELERLDRRLEGHPDRAIEAEFFVGVQLPRAADLVERYADLANAPDPGEQARKELQAAGETFDLLLKAIREQSRRVEEQDLREFAIDRRAFEELLHLEGGSATTAAAADFRSETT